MPETKSHYKYGNNGKLLASTVTTELTPSETIHDYIVRHESQEEPHYAKCRERIYYQKSDGSYSFKDVDLFIQDVRITMLNLIKEGNKIVKDWEMDKIVKHVQE